MHTSVYTRRHYTNRHLYIYINTDRGMHTYMHTLIRFCQNLEKVEQRRGLYGQGAMRPSASATSLNRRGFNAVNSAVDEDTYNTNVDLESG